MMIWPTLPILREKLTTEHTYFPLAISLSLDHQHWFSFYQLLSRSSPFHILLESGRSGRYSIMVTRPRHILKGKNRSLTVTALNHQGITINKEVYEGPLLSLLQEWLAGHRAPVIEGLSDFCGGLIGFFSYDLVRQLEKLPQLSIDDLHTPDLYFLDAEEVLVYDHHDKQHWLVMYHPVSGDLKADYHQAVAKLKTRRAEMEMVLERLLHVQHTDEANKLDVQQGAASLAHQLAEDHDLETKNFAPSLTREKFVQAVRRIKEYIGAGEVTQVNLTLRESRPLTVPPLSIYAALRRINPSPYMGYLHFPELQLVCGSPEQLIRLKEGRMSTRPIGGTRPRGKTSLEDQRLIKELVQHPKERKEHLMLVDLARHDLGKVAFPGSVQVTELMAVETYSHVLHLVSTVEAVLAPGKTAFDVLRAVFPGGSITGASKERTMEIIEELEPVRRGVYTGSIGWLDYNGNMELNIVIRTLLATQGWAHVQAGAGIVIDSIPEKEYQESLNKARALWQAVEECENERSLIE